VTPCAESFPSASSFCPKTLYSAESLVPPDGNPNTVYQEYILR
jgi:hypothetical protein